MRIYPHLLDGLQGALHLTCEPHEVFVKESAILDLSGAIYLEKGVIISDYAMLYTHEHDHSLGKGHRPVKAISKHIHADVYIGAHAIILANCDEIAEGVVIGAGAIVTHPIREANSIWAGNPARFVKMRSIENAPMSDFEFSR